MSAAPGQPLRIALFGAGWIIPLHAQAILDHPGAELTAIANWRQESMTAVAERFSIPRSTTRWEELANDPDIDAVIIGTPNYLHCPQTIACLQGGKHVLVEKPMAMNVAEANSMITASLQAERRLMIAHCWRFREEVRSVKDQIARGELGNVMKTHGYGVHAGWGPSGWFTDPALSGGGALVDLGVHAIDTARFLLGDPLPARVCATIGTHYGSYAVDDDCILLVTWSDGTNSIIESGWWQPHLGGLEADTEVFGTRGYTRIWPAADYPPDYEHCSQPMYTEQVAEFIDAIVQGREPKPNGQDGRVVLQVVEEAYRSAETA